jgi:hypothetical protein
MVEAAKIMLKADRFCGGYIKKEGKEGLEC